MPGMHVKFEITPDQFLAQLTDAAYRVALSHGLKVPFVEMELDLHEALRAVIQKTMRVSTACGERAACRENEGYEPWTGPATRIFPE